MRVSAADILANILANKQCAKKKMTKKPTSIIAAAPPLLLQHYFRRSSEIMQTGNFVRIEECGAIAFFFLATTVSRRIMKNFIDTLVNILNI